MQDTSNDHLASPATPPQRKMQVYFFFGVLSLSLLGNVVQGWMIRDLHAAIPAPAPLETRVGQKPSALRVTNLEGQVTDLAHFAKGYTVIYIFRPDCHWCVRNRMNIEALAAQSGKNFHFVGLSRPSMDMKAYLAQKPLPFPVFIDEDGSAEAALGFKGTPQTVVLSQDGTVTHNWIGVL